MSPSYRTVGYIISDVDELLAGGFLEIWRWSSLLIPESHAGATLAFNCSLLSLSISQIPLTVHEGFRCLY